MNVKAVAVSAGYWLIGAVTAVVLFCGFVVAYDASMNPQEDSGDILLNCHVYGDGDCGPNAPLHGFINVWGDGMRMEDCILLSDGWYTVVDGELVKVNSQNFSV